MPLKVSNRKFGLLMGGICLLIALYFYSIKHHFLPVLVVMGTLLILAGLFVPASLMVLNKTWILFAELLGTLNTWILLTLIYFLVFTPMGLLMRILGKRPLRLKAGKRAVTYWEKSVIAADSSVKQQF